MSTQSTVSQQVLAAKLEALKQGIGEQLGKWSRGEITDEQMKSRKSALEKAYSTWYASFEKGHGATQEETKQVREAYANQQAQVTEAKGKQLLTDWHEGKITKDELQREIDQLETSHIQRVKQILRGTYDVFHYGNPIAYKYTFKEPSAATAMAAEREPTEAEVDAYGEKEAIRLTEEKGYKVSYDPKANQLFWNQPETEAQLDTRGYAEAVTLAQERGAPVRYDPELNKLFLEPTESEIDIFGFSEAERLTEEGEAKYEYDPELNQLFRRETEKELDIRGFAEATRLTEEKGFEVTYDPELNKLFWYEQTPKAEGIPGPGRGPKEGSIGYKLQEYMSEVFGPPLEAWSKFLGGASKADFDTAALKQEQAIEKALEGKPWEGFALYAEGLYATAHGSLISGATTLIDPLATFKGIQSVVGLVDPARRKALVEHIAADPLTFSVGLGASIVGGYAGGKVISAGLGKISKYRTDKFLRDTPADDFLPYEQQYKYPQEITVLEDKWTMFKEKVTVADDLGAGFLETKRVPRGSWPTKGMGYKRTGGELIQDLIPEGMGHTETWLRPTVIKAIPRSEFLPGLSTSTAALFSVSSASSLGLATAMIGASSALSVSLPSLRTETVAKQVTKLDTRLDLDLGLKTVKGLKLISYIESVDVSIPGLRTELEPASLKEDVKLVPLTVSIPNILGRQQSALDLTQETISFQVQIPQNILDVKPVQKEMDIFTPGFGFTFKTPPPKDPLLRMPDLFREPGRRRGRTRDPFGWEEREYGMRDINTLFKGKSKRTRKKKATRKKKRKKKDDILGGIVF